MTPPVDYNPMTSKQQQQRWHKAVARIWDFTQLNPNEVPSERPGINPDHVFDFHDGLRLIVSTEQCPFGTYLHVSASFRPRSKLYERCKHGKLSIDVAISLVKERVWYVGGQEIHFAFLSPEKGVPHFFNPKLEPIYYEDVFDL